MSLSRNMRGALFMAVSMAGFTFNDAIVKTVTDEINVGQVMLVRGLFACVMVIGLAWYNGALRPARTALQPMVMLRTLGELGATVTFLTALAHIPLANTSAILQALPLAVTMGAALFLGEPVGWRRWTAISVGFIGVLIILRPGFAGFSVYALLVCVTVLFAALRDLATRQVPSHIPSLFLTGITATAITVTGAFLIEPLGGWRPLTPEIVLKLAAAASLLLFGYQFIILAMRSGDISFIAPFRYTGLLWAVLAGFFFLAETPDAAMLAGSAVIVASGIYTLYRERVVGAKQFVAHSTGPETAPDGL